MIQSKESIRFMIIKIPYTLITYL